MNLHLTRDEWERIAAEGEGVLFREGAVRDGFPYENTAPTLVPNAEFVEAAKPCETCEGTGNAPSTDWPPIPCTEPDCLDGKRRIAAVVPCENCARGGGDHPTRSNLECSCLDGHVTVATVVVEWGALVVRTYKHQIKPCLWLSPEGWLVHSTSDIDTERLTLPPDVDPQPLVGQYALGIRKVDQ